MSYFRTNLGKRPVEQPEPTAQTRPDELKQKEPPSFTKRLGPCPAQPGDHAPKGQDQSAQQAPDQPVTLSPGHPVRVCPLCRSTLLAEGSLYRCTGRCGARWLEEAPGHLIDIAGLPFGICTCCGQPQALVRGEPGAICPATGSAYLLLPEGPALLSNAAPDGLCQCCATPVPLLRRGDLLVCRARPDQHYQRTGNQIILIAPAADTRTPAETLSAIDAALRRNSARLTINGLFDLD